MAQRLMFSEDEKIHPWLPILLDVLYLCEKANDELLATCARRKISIACTNGCHACCLDQTILVTDLELSGISWYLMEKLAEPTRGQVQRQLLASQLSPKCPFLVDGSCAIYPLRPITCRQFFMKGVPCGVGEDINGTRPKDIVHPSQESVMKMSLRFLDFWNITSKKEKYRALSNGFLYNNMRPMHMVDWVAFARTMGTVASAD